MFRLGDAKQKAKVIKMCKKEGFTLTTSPYLTRMYDERTLVVSIAKVSTRVYSFIYNKNYWSDAKIEEI